MDVPLEQKIKIGRPITNTRRSEREVLAQRKRGRRIAAEKKAAKAINGTTDISKKIIEAKKVLTEKPKVDKDDFDGTAVIQEKPVDLVDDAIEKGKAFIGESLGEDDKSMLTKITKAAEAIEKYKPYLEAGMNYFKGMAANMKDRKQAQVQQEIPSMQPPQGWESLSPLARVNSMYDPMTGEVSQWWKDGEAWDNYKKSGVVTNPGTTAQNSFHPTESSEVVPTNNEFTSLQALADAHPDTNLKSLDAPSKDITEGKEIIDGEDKTDSKTSDVLKQKIEEANKRAGRDQEIKKTDLDENLELKKTEDIKTEETLKTSDETMVEKIQTQLNKDNERYIGMAVNFLSNMEDEQFLKFAKKPEKVKTTLKPLFVFLPSQTREMLANSTADEFVEVFKRDCPGKVKLLKKKGLEKNLKPVFESLLELF